MMKPTDKLRFIRPFASAESVFNKPTGVLDFLDTLMEFGAGVSFGTWYAEINLTIFSVNLRLCLNNPLSLGVNFGVAGSWVYLGFGLEQDDDAARLFKEAEAKRARFVTAVQMCKPGQTVDAADFEREEARAERKKKVIQRTFWNRNRGDSDDIPLGNETWLVFKPEGVFVEVRPVEDEGASYSEIFRGLSEEALAAGTAAATKLTAVVGVSHAGERDAEGRIIVTERQPGEFPEV